MFTFAQTSETIIIVFLIVEIFGLPKTGHVDHLLSYIIIPKDYLLDYFSRKSHDNVVNCIFLR